MLTPGGITLDEVQTSDPESSKLAKRSRELCKKAGLDVRDIRSTELLVELLSKEPHAVFCRERETLNDSSCTQL